MTTTLKNLFKQVITTFGAERWLAEWDRRLTEQKETITNGPLSELILEWTRAATDKRSWECFSAKHIAQPKIIQTTTAQSCHTLWEDIKPIDAVEKVIVWNGNGMRARNTGSQELSRLVQVTKPDVLCFWESKVNAEA